MPYVLPFFYFFYSTTFICNFNKLMCKRRKKFPHISFRNAEGNSVCFGSNNHPSTNTRRTSRANITSLCAQTMVPLLPPLTLTSTTTAATTRTTPSTKDSRCDEAHWCYVVCELIFYFLYEAPLSPLHVLQSICLKAFTKVYFSAFSLPYLPKS